jgi:hypothetical protein
MNTTSLSKSMNGSLSLSDGEITIENGQINFNDGSVLSSITDIVIKTANNIFTGINTFTADTIITSNTISSTYENGALVVAGGVGITGNLRVNGMCSINDTFSCYKNVYCATNLVVNENLFCNLNTTLYGNLVALNINNGVVIQASSARSSLIIDCDYVDRTALIASTGENVVVGKQNLIAYNSSTSSNNVMFGKNNFLAVEINQSNTGIGNNNFRLAKSNFNIGLGSWGFKAHNAIGDTYNIGIGYDTCGTNVSGVQNVAVGYNAGQNTTGSYNTFIGSQSGASSSVAYNQSTAVGYYAEITDSNQVSLGRPTATAYVNIGSTKTSNAYNNGALVVSGGVGVAGNIICNSEVNSGTLLVSGLSSLNGGATITGLLKTTNTIVNKKIVLWDNNIGEAVLSATSFFGFGINNSTLRYQTAGTTEYHRFYCGSTLNLEIGNGTIITDGTINNMKMKGSGSAVIIAGSSGTINTSLLSGAHNYIIGSDNHTNSPTSAAYNVALGTNIGTALTGGGFNIGIGVNVFAGATGANLNVSLGHRSLQYMSSGDSNVSIGYVSGKIDTESGTYSGSNNTFLGSQTQLLSGVSNVNNSTALGYGAKITTSNQVVLGRNIDYVSIPSTTSGTVNLGTTPITVNTTTAALVVAGDVGVAGNLVSNGFLYSKYRIPLWDSGFFSVVPNTSYASGTVSVLNYNPTKYPYSILINYRTATNVYPIYDITGQGLNDGYCFRWVSANSYSIRTATGTVAKIFDGTNYINCTTGQYRVYIYA